MAMRTLFRSTTRCLRLGVGELQKVPQFRRSIATATSDIPAAQPPTSGLLISVPIPPEPPASTFYSTPSNVLTTVYKFPTLEPLQFANYPSAFLKAPLRRDILHRAIIFEGDAHRLGLARTKTRSEIHGSGRKLRPQKGSGRARLGDKSSPMLRGGAKAHGPKARDFSTKLPKKMYDQAFRIAFSYRYRRGDLVVVDDLSTSDIPDKAYMREVMHKNGWGKGNKGSLLITMKENEGIRKSLDALEKEGRSLTVEEVDCKDILELGRIVIEKSALEWFLRQRCPPEVLA